MINLLIFIAIVYVSRSIAVFYDLSCKNPSRFDEFKADKPNEIKEIEKLKETIDNSLYIKLYISFMDPYYTFMKLIKK